MAQEKTKQEMNQPENSHGRRTKVCIMGFAPSWQLAPFGNDEFEIWALNELYLFLPNIPLERLRWFDIHSRPVIEAQTQSLHRTPVSDHLQKLQAMQCRLYMQKHYEDIPASIEYPLAEVTAMFVQAGHQNAYFNNSISYMLALAIYEGFEEIHLYGVDMAHDSEYFNQRPSVEFFCGFARGKGITLYTPPECDLMQTAHIYGYEEGEAIAFEVRLRSRKEEIQQKAQNHMNAIQQNQQAYHQYMGAVQELDHTLKIWKSGHTTS